MPISMVPTHIQEHGNVISWTCIQPVVFAQQVTGGRGFFFFRFFVFLFTRTCPPPTAGRRLVSTNFNYSFLLHDHVYNRWNFRVLKRMLHTCNHQIRVPHWSQVSNVVSMNPHFSRRTDVKTYVVMHERKSSGRETQNSSWSTFT